LVFSVVVPHYSSRFCYTTFWRLRELGRDTLSPDAALERTRDLTEQKRREAALRESEAHFAAIFDQTAAEFSEGDLSGRLPRVNDRFCEPVGYTHEELLKGLRMQDITHPDDLPENLRLYQRAVEAGGPSAM
jgi:PAS domain-containing protein